MLRDDLVGKMDYGEGLSFGMQTTTHNFLFVRLFAWLVLFEASFNVCKVGLKPVMYLKTLNS